MIKKLFTLFLSNFILASVASIITWAIFAGWQLAAIPVSIALFFTFVDLLIDLVGTHFKKKRRLYALNWQGVAEYIIAKSPEQAFKFANKFWGGQGMVDFEDWKQDQKPENLDGVTDFYEFLDDYTREMPMDDDFTISGNGNKTVKKIREWCMEAKKSPSYLAAEDY
jgi:hypothetical protein